MHIKDWIQLLLALIGFSLLLGLIRLALFDMLTLKMPQRKPIYNAVIVVLSVVYLVKIMVADLLPYLGFKGTSF